MKKILSILIISLAICSTNAQWKTELENNGTVYRMGMGATANDLFWVQDSSLYSQHSGRLFAVCHSPLIASNASIVFSDELYGLALVNCYTPDSPYYRYKAWETENAGKDWKELPVEMPSGNMMVSVISNPYKSLVIVNAGKWYFNTYNGCLLSTDKGRSWKPAMLDRDTFSTLAWHDGEKNLAAKSRYEFMQDDFTLSLSKDGGQSWSLFFDNKKHLDTMNFIHYDIARIVKAENRYYILRHRYVPSCGLMYIGSDLFYTDGEGWKKTELPKNNSVYDPPADMIFTSKDTGFIAWGKNILRSTDGGRSWQLFSTLSQDESVLSFWKNGGRFFVFNNRGGVSSLSTSGGSQAGISRDPAVSVKVFPNPMPQGVELSVRGFERSLRPVYQVYDMAGRFVTEGRIQSQSIVLPAMAQGTYRLRLSDETGINHAVSLIIQ